MGTFGRMLRENKKKEKDIYICKDWAGVPALDEAM